ncbi:MAG: hypothetical protein EAX95_16005 [Candidatus Thorarchaeota archaeon]|nr:hypothetical protein [Candidatus Thorarchaeota archaeon]
MNLGGLNQEGKEIIKLLKKTKRINQSDALYLLDVLHKMSTNSIKISNGPLQLIVGVVRKTRDLMKKFPEIFMDAKATRTRSLLSLPDLMKARY